MMAWPAVLSIFFWRYVPLVMGSGMAFQNYRIMGGSEFVWVDNFANLIWDGEWWRAVYNSLRYSILVVAMTFLPPVILAVLLQEIPKGKIVGQFLAQDGGEEFGLLFAKDNPLVTCVNKVLTELKDSGELQAIQDEWLAGTTAPYFTE